MRSGTDFPNNCKVQGTRRTKVVLSLLALPTLIASVLLMPPDIARASGGGDGCNPNRSTDYYTQRTVGWYRDAAGLTDVSADIKNYSPYVAVSSDGSDAGMAWVMETDGHQAYAQIGWWEYAFGQRSVFVQWSVPGAKPFTPIYTPAPPINSVSNYSIHLVNPGGFTYAFNNISLQANGPQYFWPGQAQNFGETLSFASQVPGGFNNAKDFANVSIKFGGSTDWLKGTAFFSGPKYVVDREPGGVLDESCPDQ